MTDRTTYELWGSYLLFVKTFFPIVTGRNFYISQPTCRESHFNIIAEELTKVARLEQRDLIINVPPGHGKSVMMSMFVAWTMAKYPDSNYMYVSYSQTLAAKHTEFIKRIMLCKEYEEAFGVKIRKDSRAKDFFQTEQNGSIKAFGSRGAITGQDAGLPNLERFSGAVIMDDMHKPDEVHSDTIREGVIENYKETIIQRPRGPNVPIICIGQRLHEADICDYLMSEESERKFNRVVLKAIDAAGNALYPEVNPKEDLLIKQQKSPYVFASQFQQDPVPAGGALFKIKDFIYLEEEPKILATFITVDTAETAKTHNDATVFSFWGLYEIIEGGHETGIRALHCLDVDEMWIEPKHLKSEFMRFYTECLRHPVKPTVAAIEKKSTGVTLLSVLEDVRGLEIRDIQRTKASGSKTERFLEIQPIIASKRVSFTEGARHAEKVIMHMSKITANDTHRRDDIADTMYDAIKIALLDETIYTPKHEESNIAKILANEFKTQQSIRERAFYD